MILYDNYSGYYVVLRRRDDGEVGGWYGSSENNAKTVDKENSDRFLWKARSIKEHEFPPSLYKTIRKGMARMVKPKNKRIMV